MIWIYTGTPGSGKSLHMAQDILFKVARGQNVIANFPIKEDMIKGRHKGHFLYIKDETMTPKYLYEYTQLHHKSGKEGQALLIIDEAQRIFPSQGTMINRKGWLEFFQLHRHYGFNIILATQSMSYLNRGIRGLCEYEVRHRKLNNYKLFGALLGLVSGGALFVAVTYWVGARERIGSEYFKYKKKYSRLYDSFADFETSYTNTIEKKEVNVPDQEITLLKSPVQEVKIIVKEEPVETLVYDLDDDFLFIDLKQAN